MKNMRKIKVLLILLILPVLNGRAFTEKELVADGQEKNRTQERSGVPSTGDVDVASLEIDASRLGAPIQSTMYGVFFEDINFGADGGLYAELIKNRSFEFPQPLVGWVPFGQVEVKTDRPCFDRNPHYVSITNDGRLLRAGLDNEGFRGIGLKEGREYCFSAYVRSRDDKPMTLSVVKLLIKD